MCLRFDTQLGQAPEQIVWRCHARCYLGWRPHERCVFRPDFKRHLRSRGHPHIYNAVFSGCGCSSGVERNLAKVEVVSSNLITRSNFILIVPKTPCLFVLVVTE